MYRLTSSVSKKNFDIIHFDYVSQQIGGLADILFYSGWSCIRPVSVVLRRAWARNPRSGWLLVTSHQGFASFIAVGHVPYWKKNTMDI